MSAQPIREEAIRLINEFNEEELRRAIELLKTIQLATTEKPYDPDPAIGFFSAEPDFAETSQEILRREYGLKKPQDTQNE